MRATLLLGWVLSLGLIVACSSEDDSSTASGAQGSASGASGGASAGGATGAGGTAGSTGGGGDAGQGGAGGLGGLGGAGGAGGAGGHGGTGGNGTGGGAGEGEVCAGSVIATCAPGLVCCYPCGIPDCDSLCTVPCEPGDPGCGDGGCLLVP